MGSTAQIMWGILFGSLGMGYFIYGKKQGRPVPLIAGICLCIFPSFLSNTWVMVLVGTALSALPFVVKI